MKHRSIAVLLATPALLAALMAYAGDTSPAALIAGYEADAGHKADPAAGRTFFFAEHNGGKPDTPSCTTCHTSDPTTTGKLRTGKPVEPLAPSVNAARFSEVASVEKWFRRNCNSVLGRECTASEKADVIAWLATL